MDAELIPTRHEPSTLSPQKAERIIAHVRAGQYPSVAALLECVAKRTWRQWMAWGQEELDRDLLPGDGTLAQLVERVDRAACHRSPAEVPRLRTNAG